MRKLFPVVRQFVSLELADEVEMLFDFGLGVIDVNPCRLGE